MAIQKKTCQTWLEMPGDDPKLTQAARCAARCAKARKSLTSVAALWWNVATNGIPSSATNVRSWRSWLGAKIMALKTVSSCFIWFTMWKKWSWSHEPWNFGLSNFQTKQYFNARNQAGWISISKQSPKTSVHIGGNTTYTNHSQWMSMAFFNTLLRSRMALKPVAIMTRCFTRCFTTLLEHWTNAHRSSLLHGSQCHFAAGWWTRPGRPWSWSWGLGG